MPSLGSSDEIQKRVQIVLSCTRRMSDDVSHYHPAPILGVLMPATLPWSSLGSYLLAARHRTGRSQKHVAHEMGISQAAYSQIERGLVRPRPALICRLAIVLGTDVTRLAALAKYSLDRVLTAAQADNRQ